MRVVVDTNVIVSALMNANGSPAKILSLIFNGSVIMRYDNRIIFEYSEVLSRKEFGFSADLINDMINFFKHEGEYINADPVNVKFLDETDKKFYEVYRFGNPRRSPKLPQYLVTGNKRHFPKEASIINTKEFIEIYSVT